MKQKIPHSFATGKNIEVYTTNERIIYNLRIRFPSLFRPYKITGKE